MESAVQRNVLTDAFFEAHQYIEGVGRWRCSKCRPGIENKPRFWNQYSGKCEYCEHADRLGLVCNKIETEKCKLPLIKTNGGCAFECPLGETLNMKDGSCIKCPWSWQENQKDGKKRFNIGNEGCDTTCYVFGTISALTTNLMTRKVPINHTDYINSGNPIEDEKSSGNQRQCRILVGDMDINQVTRWTYQGLDPLVREINAVYGNVRFNNLIDKKEVSIFKIFQNARQIAGNLQIQKVLEAPDDNPVYFAHLKKLGGEFTKIDAPALQFEVKITAAKELATTEGLYWHSALFDGSGACSDFCKEGTCMSGASKASWGCISCKENSFKIEEEGLFSCISECPEGFYEAENKECKRCHPNCLGGCKAAGAVFPDACNKCKIYVSNGAQFECKSLATEKRCDSSSKDSDGNCSGLMSGGQLIERMIADLKPFPEES
ncbi:hypothetical protein M3Y94_01005700 [Aphelenchoides besseyi]|nr:hypothetical protein M3Y94_01005700 [Aphelenchoides besseyi]